MVATERRPIACHGTVEELGTPSGPPIDSAAARAANDLTEDFVWIAGWAATPTAIATRSGQSPVPFGPSAGSTLRRCVVRQAPAIAAIHLEGTGFSARPANRVRHSPSPSPSARACLAEGVSAVSGTRSIPAIASIGVGGAPNSTRPDRHMQ